MLKNNNDSLKRTYLIGVVKTQEAKTFQAGTNPKISDAELLYQFNTDLEAVWSSKSILVSKIFIYIVYLCSLVAISLSIVGGYDISRAKRKKRKSTPRKRKTSKPIPKE